MKKILVCEDEAAIRDFVVINLRRAGYDVVEADCGEVALQKYEEHGGDRGRDGWTAPPTRRTRV